MNLSPQLGVGQDQSIRSQLVTLILPRAYNDGCSIEVEHVTWAQQTITAFAGGLTQFPPSEGFWIDPQGTLCQDSIQIIQIAVRDVPETELKTWLVHFATELAQRCQQDEVFLFIQPVSLLEVMPYMLPRTSVSLPVQTVLAAYGGIN